MANIRQSILIRTDLNLPKGLSEAQVAHLHFEYLRKIILQNLKKENDAIFNSSHIALPSDVCEWLKAPYTFVHGVPNAEILRYFQSDAIQKGIYMNDWKDTIYLKVSGTQQIVVEDCLIGIVLFGDSDKVKAVIGDLPLLS
jgi:peptidyl-tRNA hydrolase